MREFVCQRIIYHEWRAPRQWRAGSSAQRWPSLAEKQAFVVRRLENRKLKGFLSGRKLFGKVVRTAANK